MTVPPQLWPTSTTLPGAAAIARRVAATSSANEVSGFCTATAGSFQSCRVLMTLLQLEPSAKAPCTRMTVGGAAVSTWLAKAGTAAPARARAAASNEVRIMGGTPVLGMAISACRCITAVSPLRGVVPDCRAQAGFYSGIHSRAGPGWALSGEYRSPHAGAQRPDVRQRIVFVSDCTKPRPRPQSLTKPRATAHVADTCAAWNGLHRPLARRTPP